MAVFTTAALLLWALLVAVIDGRQRRIPNLLLLVLLLPATAVLCWQGVGLLSATVSSSVIGMVVALAITLPGYAVSRLGAGDVKLAAVMGFVQGWPWGSYSLLLAALLLGLNAMLRVAMVSFPRVRAVRVPTAWALLAGFAAVLLVQQGVL